MSQEILIVELGTEKKRPDIERRRLPRFDCAETTRCISQSTGVSFWARVKNVSKGGMGMVLSQPIVVGMLLTATPWRAATSLQAQVIHCTRITDGSWFVGCRFITTLTDEAFERILKAWR